MQEGPKLQTFYTCKDENSMCKYYETVWLLVKKEEIDRCALTQEDLVSCYEGYVKTPIDCPLLGKSQEYDIRFDKDVLMRNL